MIRFLIRSIAFVASAAVGLLVAAWIIDDVSVTSSGFLLVVVLFAVVQSVSAPFLARVAATHFRAFLGGIGLAATFVALLVTTVVGDALTITGGVATWVLATLVVWLATAVATALLPTILLAGAKRRRRGKPRSAPLTRVRTTDADRRRRHSSENGV